MKLPKISQTDFIKYGAILFTFSSLGNIISTCIRWLPMDIGQKISAISSVLFSMLLAYFFYYMWKTTRGAEIQDNPELDEFLQELNEEDKNEK